MRTDAHLSECKLLSQKLIPQMFKFSGHAVFHQDTNNTNYISVVTVNKSINAFCTPKSYFPSNLATNDKFSLESCLIFAISMVQVD